MVDFELFNLKEDERLIIKKQASHVKTTLIIPQPNPGNLSVTDKRVLFQPTQGRSSSGFICNLEDIEHFSVGLMNTITIFTKNGEKYKLTGLFNKDIIKALEEVKVKKEK